MRRLLLPLIAAGLCASLPLAAQSAPPQPHICLGPTSVESTPGSAMTAANAVRETFAAFLTGPTLGTASLSARLESQAREEAKQVGCPFVLYTTLKHEQKRGGGGSLLGRMAGGAAQQGAWAAGSAVGSAAGRVAAGAAASAAYDYSANVRNKDVMTLGYRLESAAGGVVAEDSEKRKAKSDNEDMLTPLVQRASEAVAAQVTKGGK
ncbi:MAG: hypothetical protein ABJC36_13905 [Gemmatimonadales bacterium]